MLGSLRKMAPPAVRAIADLPDACQLRILSMLERSEVRTAAVSLDNGSEAPARSDTQLADSGCSTAPTTSCGPQIDDSVVVGEAMKALNENGYAVLQAAMMKELVSLLLRNCCGIVGEEEGSAGKV